MTRRALPIFEPRKPIRAPHLNRLSTELGRITGLPTGGDDEYVDNACGRFYLPGSRTTIGATSIIRFQIVTVETSPEVRALTSPLGTAPGSNGGAALPEQTADGEFYVYDPSGCHFNEVSGDLLGRQGYAVYLESANPNYTGTGTGSEAATRSRWEVMFLCCRTDYCPEITG